MTNHPSRTRKSRSQHVNDLIDARWHANAVTSWMVGKRVIRDADGLTGVVLRAVVVRTRQPLELVVRSDACIEFQVTTRGLRVV